MSAHIKKVLVTAVGVVGIGGCWSHQSVTARTIPTATTTTTSTILTTSSEHQATLAQKQQAEQQQRTAQLMQQAANEQQLAARRQLQAAQLQQRAAAGEQTAAQQAEQQQQRGGGDIHVSPAIIQACALSADTMAHAPKFETDSSFILMRDQPVLQQVATCVTQGQLKGRSLFLIGRTDNRGSEQYNMVLGGARAAEVSDVLIGMGVPAAKVAATSRGKMDATGTTPAQQALDRRVDIEVK